MYRKIIFVAGIIAALCGTITSAGTGDPRSTDTTITIVLSNGGYFASDEEMEKLLNAKDSVFKREWKSAIGRLEEYIRDYSRGRFMDEALYWLAASLNKSCQEETNAQQILALKEQAIDKLDVLLGSYPESLWRDDAETLKIEISGQLALLGKKEHKAYIEKFLSETDENPSDVKIAALRELAKLTPEAALPAFETALHNDSDPSFRIKCVYLLATSFPNAALPILSALENTDPEEDVRDEIAKTLQKVKIQLIPVQLNYYVYSGELDDRRELARIPENDLKSFDLPRIGSTSKGKIKKALEKFFNGKLSHLQFTANSYGVGELFNFSVSHNVSGFNIKVLADGYRKEYDQIGGTVRFTDLDTERSHKVVYTVDKNNEVLLATRKGNRVALMVLQFESHEETDAERAEANEPVYYHEHNNVLGCRVHSSRQSFSWDELMLGTAMVDYGRAKVEIPYEGGKWVLIGDILLNTKKRLFIGRRAELFDATGGSVTKAAQIVIDIDNPADYKVTGEE